MLNVAFCQGFPAARVADQAPPLPMSAIPTPHSLPAGPMTSSACIECQEAYKTGQDRGRGDMKQLSPGSKQHSNPWE